MGTKARRLRVEALVERDGTACTWCCRQMIDAPIVPGRDCSLHMTLEHIVPISQGGTHDLWNLALACFQCNNVRGSSRIEFRPDWASGLAVGE